MPVTINGSYDLETEFTRVDGHGNICCLIPVDDKHCSVDLSSFSGDDQRVSGLANIDGHAPSDAANPTRVQPGQLENGHRYKLLVSVRLLGDRRASVDVFLDGKQYLPHWVGSVNSLSTHEAWRLPHSRRFGLGSHENVAVFHLVRLRMISGQASVVGATENRRVSKSDSVRPVPVVPANADGSFPLGQWVDVLGLTDTKRDARNGQWSRDGKEISVEPGAYPHVELPVTVDGGYDLEVEFTRTDGAGCFGAILPVGTHRSMALLSGWNGAASGLDFLNGKAARDDGNPTSVRPGTLENGHRYQLVASVRMLPDDQASVDVSLDGKPYFPHWEGKPAALDLYGGWFMSHAKRPGLAAQSHTVFHAIRLRMISGSAKTDVG
jgi:hypothetical protein